MDEKAVIPAYLIEWLEEMASKAPPEGVICAPTMAMGNGWKAKALLQTIRARLVELEAENERLREWRNLVAEHNEGCEQACDMDRCGYRPYFENNGRRCSECPHFNTIDIPAHLSENGHG